MSERVEVCIIGGGIIGTQTALELSNQGREIFLFDRHPGLAKGENQSSRNSGVNHAGLYYDQETRPLKAALCVAGNRLWHEFCQKHDLPYKQVGKILVAMDQTEDRILDAYLDQALKNGVINPRKISGGKVTELEPNVRAFSGLLLPSSGIFDPAALTYKSGVLAGNNGATLMFETSVVDLTPAPEGIRVVLEYRDGARDEILAGLVINAAGVYGVDVARMVDPDFPIKPALVRGDSLKFYHTRRPEIGHAGMNVYPTPIVLDTPTGRQYTLGVHLTPTFDVENGRPCIGKTVTLGPKLSPVKHFEDFTETPPPPVEAFLERLDFFPGLKAEDIEPHQSGIQARLNGAPDFYIKKDRVSPRVLHLVGIDSPGFTAAPAIARYIIELIDKEDG